MTRMGLFLFAMLAMQVAQAQNVKNEDVQYTYIKLPLTPLQPSIKHYKSYVTAAYEADNQRMRTKYEADLAVAEADYQRELAAHPGNVKAAEERYAAEMAEWEKKPLSEKFVEKQILKENNKPVKQLPSPPYKRNVEQPKMQRTYDYQALASTYLILEGYENNPDRAIKIEITLNGFDYTQPQVITENKNMVSVVNGTSTTTQVPHYNIEFTYRHTMSVKVTDPDGKELLYISPQELNTYKTYKSAQTKTYQTINEESLVKPFEEKILQENMVFINNLVNDRFGFKRETRKTELGYVKAKDDSYTDLLVAYNEASSGLKTLLDDEENAKAKLMKSITAWNTALLESDVNNKKARIDKDVTGMIYFNLLETYFALRNVDGGEKTIATLNTMSMSNSDRKQKEKYEALFNDLKKRIAANK